MISDLNIQNKASTCLVRCQNRKHNKATNSNFLFKAVSPHIKFYRFSRLIHSSYASPGAGRKEAGTFAELSSSQTSRLIQNERRLNPLLKIWRGTDAHAVEALLWSAAREVRILTICHICEDVECSTIESHPKKIKTFFLTVFQK